MPEEQLTEQQKQELTKQQYRLVGSHSAVKVCGWTKNMLRGRGVCYKEKFYGIRCHQCLQMTTSMYCANRCKFCWRGEKAPVSKEWYGKIDEPNEIIDQSLIAQKKLLAGFGGNEKTKPEDLEEAYNVRHVALSLTGEPITYPKLNEILTDFHKRGISSFLVTNGQFPEQIENIKYVTQLYLSVDAPNKEQLKDIDRPLFPDFYERMLKSLEILATRPYRTCIRLTVIKNVNDEDLEGYKKLINLGQPDFIEVKAYMFLGASRDILKEENMPFHEDVEELTKKLAELLQDYEIVDEHPPSRVLLLMKKNLKKQKFINFPKFFELVNNNQELTKENYSSKDLCPNK